MFGSASASADTRFSSTRGKAAGVRECHGAVVLGFIQVGGCARADVRVRSYGGNRVLRYEDCHRYNRSAYCRNRNTQRVTVGVRAGAGMRTRGAPIRPTHSSRPVFGSTHKQTGKSWRNGW